jgi:hypothetical protein
MGALLPEGVSRYFGAYSIGAPNRRREENDRLPLPPAAGNHLHRSFKDRDKRNRASGANLAGTRTLSCGIGKEM